MKSMCQEARRNSPSDTAAEPDVLLHPHRLADRLVLDGTQLGVVDAARLVVAARLMERGWPQQAADVVGPERWCRARRHARRCIARGLLDARRPGDMITP